MQSTNFQFLQSSKQFIFKSNILILIFLKLKKKINEKSSLDHYATSPTSTVIQYFCVELIYKNVQPFWVETNEIETRNFFFLCISDSGFQDQYPKNCSFAV